MSEDVYTEVTEESWFSRIKNAVVGIFVGLILILVSFVLLFWNEGRAVKRYKALKEGSAAVVSIASDQIRGEHEGDLVHMTGLATTEDFLQDPEFPVSASVLKLKRSVTMYQWDEDKNTREEKKVGGGTRKITEYTYNKVWSSNVIDSSGFKKPSGHQNSGHIPFRSFIKTADRVTLGSFVLSGSLIGKINTFEPLPAGLSNELPDTGGREIKSYNGGYYLGLDPGNPEIGDVKILFKQVRPTTVSIIARQAGSSFRPYQTSSGGAIEELSIGTVGAAMMFQQAQSRNTMLTWGLRLVGFIVMIIGFSMLFKPLSVLADVIPFIGNIVEFGTGLIALLLSLILSLVTIAIAWIVYRPLLAGVLFTVAVFVLVGSIQAGRKKIKKTSGKKPITPETKKVEEQVKFPAEEAAFGDQIQETVDDPFLSDTSSASSEDPFLTDSSGSSMSNSGPAPSKDQLLDSGKKLFSEEDYEGAVNAFSDAIRIDVGFAPAYYNRGIAYNKTGNKEGFMNDFKLAARFGHQKAADYLDSKNIDYS